jgi:hypothetical protein
MFIDDTKKKLSLGFLRRANKTKLRSPDWTGTLNLQRETLKTIVKQLEDSGEDNVACCIAAWEKQDKKENHSLPYNCHPSSCHAKHRCLKKALWHAFWVVLEKSNEALSSNTP